MIPTELDEIAKYIIGPLGGPAILVLGIRYFINKAEKAQTEYVSSLNNIISAFKQELDLCHQTKTDLINRLLGKTDD